MFNRNATQNEVFMALAKCVPAISSPVGGMPLTSLTAINNVDMNMPDAQLGVPRPNDWGRKHKTFVKAWLHSDMKDMAFFYVHELYKQLGQKGNLK